MGGRLHRGAGSMLGVRAQCCHALQLPCQVRRDGRLDDGLDEGVGGRDLAPEEDVFGRVHEDRDHCGDV